MFRKVGKKDSRYLAKLVTENRAPCAFCHRDEDDEVTFGKLYAIGEIQCHYLCALLSCCLVQKGPDEEGLFGFMYRDILAELERSKKHKCSYCGCGGANLGCSVSSCRKQFHLPCGRERNAVSLFHGSFKSFCQIHAPKQSIPDHIMCKAKLRMKDGHKKPVLKDNVPAEQSSEEGMVCVICYEAVDGFPTVNTFWPPCCGKDAWFHRKCLQRMALSAGMHYLKCPLCNDKEHFYDAVESQGYYVPDRDAAWELEQNAFAEIYERPLTCTAEVCQCPNGRSHDVDQGMWDIKLCLLCGSVGAHAQCIGANETTRYVCLTCTPAAPDDLQTLADTIEKLILEEQAIAASNVRQGPVMPSRMSLRRTKGRLALLNKPSGSREHHAKTEYASPAQSPSIQSSRQELNLKTPRKLTNSYRTDSPRKSIHTNTYTENNSPNKTLQQSLNESNMEANLTPIKLPQNSDSYKNVKAIFLSPLKHLEQSFKDKIMCMGGNAVLDDRVVDILRRRFNKPRPLSQKKKIIDDILNGLFDNFDNPLKQKDPMREWCSPKKSSITNGEENFTNASDNGTEPARNTVENKVNHMQDTPRKSKKINIHISTPYKVQITPKFSENAMTDVTAKKDSTETSDDKQINEKNHQEITDLKEIDVTNDDSSNSTFQLPSEFIAEALSDDSYMTFQSPKRKTIEMKDSSIEISEQDHSVNIDVVKVSDRTDASSPDVKQKSVFQFSRLNSETLDEGMVGMDLESFKKEYLKEVNANYKCCFSHHHDHEISPLTNVTFRTVIDFAIEAHLHKATNHQPGKKRKLSESSLVLSYDKTIAKKRKLSENILNSSLSSDDFEIKKEFKIPEKHVENTVHEISDKNKTPKLTTKDKRRDNRKKKRNEKHSERKRSNTDRKLKNKDEVLPEQKEKRTKEIKKEHTKILVKSYKRILPDGKLESKDKRTKDRKTESEKSRIKLNSNNQKKIPKNHDRNLAEDLGKKQKPEKKNDLEKNKEKKRKHITEDKQSIQLNLNDENKKQRYRRKCPLSINSDKRMRDKNRDGKDKLVKNKGKLNQDGKRIQKNKLSITDEKTGPHVEKHKKSDKYTKTKKYDRNSTKYVKDKKANDGQNIEVTIDSSNSKGKSNKKTKTKLSISNSEKNNISVKIKWRKKLLSLKIKSKKKKAVEVEKDNSKFKQYVLQYFSEVTPKEVLVKPEKEVIPLKRKYVKQDKTPDKLKQMSIQNFFKKSE